MGACGGAGAHRSKAHGSGRSSATCGRGVVVHGSGSGGLLRPPGVTRNTVTRAGVTGLGSCHRGAMAGGEELAGAVVELARRGKRAWGGRVGRCSVFLGTRRGRQRARTRRAGPLAATTSWLAATSSRARRSPWLKERIGIRERGVRCGGSQRWRWDARRGRGRPGADEFVDGDRRVRRGEERRGGASGLLRSREMAGRVRMEWRSWWASWGSEGGPVAAVVASGGDGGSVRGGKQRGGRAFGEERGSSEGGRGERGHEA